MKIKLLFVTVFLSTLSFSQKKWTLKECVDYALKNNISIQQNKLNIKVAENDVKSAKGNFLPSVSASTGGNLNFGSTFDEPFFSGNLGVNSAYTIFNGYRNLNTYKQAQLGIEASKLDLQVIENDVSLQVVNAYLNVLFAKENLNLANTQYEISNKQIERAQLQFKAGTIPKVDLTNVQATAASNSQGVITAENNLNLALFRLSQLIQIPSKDFDVATIQIDNPSVLLYDNSTLVYDKAVKNRPEIKRQELSIKNADISKELAKSGYRPTVTASGVVGTNYGFNLDLPQGASNTAFGTQLDNNLDYGVGFNVNIPIFNGFKNDANVERAEIQKEIIKTQLDNQKLQLRQTIEQAYLDAKLASKTYDVAKTSLEAQKQAFANAQSSYDYGAMTLFDFEQIRNRLVNAEATLIRSKYDYVFKSKVLQFYYGDTFLE